MKINNKTKANNKDNSINNINNSNNTSNFNELCVKGTVTTGYGKGAYFIGQEFYFNELSNELEFPPFKGTLNLIIDDEDVANVTKIKKNFTKLIKGRDNLGDVNYIKIIIAKVSNSNHNINTAGNCDGGNISINGANGNNNPMATGKIVQGAIVFPAKTQHPNDYLEIIAKEQLRAELALEDGDAVIISVLK
ncbi:MAG: DUF120 domain-containing protein [Methanobacteriaceae archaeon]